MKEKYDKDQNSDQLVKGLSNFYQKKILNDHKTEVEELLDIFE